MGLLKVGYTTVDAQSRVAQQYPTKRPGKPPYRKDFELLVSLGVFNSALMNDAVFKFKRYEDSSLSYTGIDKHEGENIGLYDTVLTQKDAGNVFENVSKLTQRPVTKNE